MSEAEYQIVAQVHDQFLTEDKRDTFDGWEITFKDVQSGVSGVVRIADDFYTAENVRAQILHLLPTIRNVHQLRN